MTTWPVFCARCPSRAVWRVTAPTRAAVCCDEHRVAVVRWATARGVTPTVELLEGEEPPTLF